MSLDFEIQPAQQAESTVADPLETYNQLVAGELCPLEAGLMHEPTKLSEGLKANLYTQPRVSKMHPDGSYEEKEIVKIKTMGDLTEDGEKLIAGLRKLTEDGEAYLTTKKLGMWRVYRQGMRRGADETPQVLVNVIGIGKSLFPGVDLMKMRMFGPARPPLAYEIQLKGDNANDDYNHALEIVGLNLGVDDRNRVHAHIAGIYEPAAFTTTLARGYRQANALQWIYGVLDWEAIQKMPATKRAYQMGLITAHIAKILVLGTDAA